MLAADATLVTERHRIKDLDNYLRIVFGHMRSCQNKHGNAHLRIGVLGSGAAPNHKVVHDAGDKEISYGAYSGEHAFTDVEVQEGVTWSSARMSYADVEALFSEVRGYNRGKR
jgi:hypothetical protein